MIEIIFHVVATLLLGFIASLWSTADAFNKAMKIFLSAVTVSGAVIIARDLIEAGWL